VPDTATPFVTATRVVALADLGERLAPLRLCEASALAAVRRSLERHGQMCALTLFVTGDDGDELELLDGFKRVRAARALGWSTLLARVDDVGVIDAKLRLCELHEHRGLTELEQAWLVRSLYRDDGLSQPEIAQRMGRHKSWVCRRLMLVEALDPAVQADVRLGLIAPRAAVTLGRLPRGNQHAASAVVGRRGFTVRQTELLVDEVIACADADARAALLARRMDADAAGERPGPRPTRVRNARSDADRIAQDIATLHAVAARLEAQLLASPLVALVPAAAEIIGASLAALVPVLRALDKVITIVTRSKDAA